MSVASAGPLLLFQIKKALGLAATFVNAIDHNLGSLFVLDSQSFLF